jgi:hypothetical protein
LKQAQCACHMSFLGALPGAPAWQRCGPGAAAVAVADQGGGGHPGQGLVSVPQAGTNPSSLVPPDHPRVPSTGQLGYQGGSSWRWQGGQPEQIEMPQYIIHPRPHCLERAETRPSTWVACPITTRESGCRRGFLKEWGGAPGDASKHAAEPAPKRARAVVEAQAQWSNSTATSEGQFPIPLTPDLVRQTTRKQVNPARRSATGTSYSDTPEDEGTRGQARPK